MKEFKDVKNIHFTVTYAGKGCVNFDGKEQSYFLAKNKLSPTSNNNVCYAKKDFHPKSDDTMTFNYKVSSECLRNAVFKEAMPFQNPNILAVEHMLYNALATPEMIARGYVFTQQNKNGLKKKSILTLTDGVELTEEERKSIALDFHSKTCEKTTKTNDDDKSDTTIYNIENVGNNDYVAEGYIDLLEAQFISDDPTYDRASLGILEDGSKQEKIFLDAISKKMVNMPNPKMEYYYKEGCYLQDEWGERGLLLNEESVNDLVKRTFKGLMETLILRRNAYLRFKSLTITVNMVGGKEETFDITLSDLNDLYFGYHKNYHKCDYDKIIENKKKVEAFKEANKNSKNK